jgi:hypothetical protein
VILSFSLFCVFTAYCAHYCTRRFSFCPPDFCSGGETFTPDGTFFDVLTIKGFTEEDMEYRLVKFYADVSPFIN